MSCNFSPWMLMFLLFVFWRSRSGLLKYENHKLIFSFMSLEQQFYCWMPFRYKPSQSRKEVVSFYLPHHRTRNWNLYSGLCTRSLAFYKDEVRYVRSTVHIHPYLPLRVSITIVVINIVINFQLTNNIEDRIKTSMENQKQILQNKC